MFIEFFNNSNQNVAFQAERVEITLLGYETVQDFEKKKSNPNPVKSSLLKALLCKNMLFPNCRLAPKKRN